MQSYTVLIENAKRLAVACAVLTFVGCGGAEEENVSAEPTAAESVDADTSRGPKGGIIYVDSAPAPGGRTTTTTTSTPSVTANVGGIILGESGSTQRRPRTGQ